MKKTPTNKSIGDIAIIGMAGRFPGARDVETFWHNLKNGVESVSFFTDAELAAVGVDPELLANPNYVKARPMLEDVEAFDAEFFGFSPREAETMDPQHRLFLETASAALEDAGYDSWRYEGAIGTYGGLYFDSYLLANLCTNWQRTQSLLNYSEPGTYQTYLGNDKDYLTSRVAYKLNLKGPALTILTACSSSLVAVCQACQSLHTYQCDMALAGGVTVLVPQKKGYLYQEGGMMSSDGHCRPFDARAQGTLFGSGVGLVLLKRLEEAVADGDHVYAVIKGSAINNDGAVKVSFTAPSVDGQAEVIVLAQALAGVRADSINYIEAHGTGTPLGDPIEVAALTQAFRDSTDKCGFCGIGSLKSNVGHLDVAAGVAGLIKTTMALKNKLIPPTLHFTAPNPKINFPNTPFYVVTEPTEWKANGTPRRAGVSAFGVGGTNAHVVLEEAPAIEPSGPSRAAHLLMLSAKTSAALDRATAQLATHLKTHPDLELADVAYTLQVGRRIMPHRRVVICHDTPDAVTHLEKPDPKRVFTQTHERGDPLIVFMFPGQGSQYVGMGADLYHSEPVFRTEVDRCAEFLRPMLQTDLRAILYPVEGSEKEAEQLLVQTRFTQPALFVIEYALATLWISWGIKPSAMIGHSVGEYVAGCLAGVFSLPDALRLIAERARLVQQQPNGAMLAVGLPENEVLPLLNGSGQLAIAAINSSRMCVVAGPHDEIAELEKRLSSREVSLRHIHTSHAFHSPMMEPVLAPFTEVVRQVSLHAPQIPYVSNVTAQWITPADATDPHYWAVHVRQPVRFAEGIARFMQDPTAVLLEVGPGQTLSTLARQHPDWKREQAVLNSLTRGEEPDSIIVACGRLWLAGRGVDAEAFFANERRQRVSLPTYPFERKRHWVEPDGVTSTAIPTVHVNEPTLVPGGTKPASRADELKAILRELSGKDYGDADDNVPFLELGFESLFLTQVSLAIAKRFGVQVAFRQLLGELNTLNLLAAHLDKDMPPTNVALLAPPPATAVPQSAPLTDAQREVWLAKEMGDAASCAFNQSCALHLRGLLQREVLETALQELVQRHDGLRATFSASGDFQAVTPGLAIEPQFLELTGRTEELDGLLAKEAAEPFDLERGPLLRVRFVKLGEQHHVVLFTVHHIVCDGRSLSLLLHELGELYSARSHGQTAALRPARSLMAYAIEETRQSESPERQAAEAYWLHQYSEPPPALDLSVDFPRPNRKSFRGKLASLEIPPALCRELKHSGAQQGCTLFTTLLAAYYVLLHRLTGQVDIVVGVPFATPGVEADEPLVGHIVNFLALRSCPIGDIPWIEHLQAVKRLVLEAFEHRHYTYGLLIQKLMLPRDLSRIPLLAASFNLAQSRRPLWFEGLQPETMLNPYSFTNLDLTFGFNQDGDALTLDCIYNADLFDAPTIERWLRYYETLLNAVTISPPEILDKLPILSEVERRKQIVDWNSTAVKVPEHRGLHEWFESQVIRTPEARALTFEDSHLTYGELNRRANQLARHLKALGVGPEVLVGLKVERSLEMVIGLLGILKAGGAYVPLDPSFPQERLAFVVENSGMRVLITHRKLDKNLQIRPASIVLLDSDWDQIAKQSFFDLKSPNSNPGNLAYVLYTSGSTGKPKGVEIPHSAVVNFLFSMQCEPGFAETDTLLAVTTLSFDIAGLELYLPLVSGGRVVIATYEDTRDPARLMERMRSSNCTVMQATPATWRTLIDAGWSGSPNLKVLCGGESLPGDLLQKLLPRCKELWNMYGPTETTIWSTVQRVTSADTPVLIGRPIANTQTLVLDGQRNLVPEGVLGELYIGGAGVARSYLGRPELTEERFVQSPFEPRTRLYRTGDLARWTSGGYLECLGRIDTQVKIRGYRIELGEIETALSRHEAVRQCVVVAREDTPGNKRLVAYFEPRTESTPAVSDLRAYLAKGLPDYMIPSIIVPLKKLPVTPNGKIDRRALPTPAYEHMQPAHDSVPPQTETEKALALIWTELLRIDNIGINDEFFNLGGHSLLAIQAVSRIRDEFGVKIGIQTLFDNPTIAGLANVLTVAKSSEAKTGQQQLLVRIRRGTSERSPFFCLHGAGGNVLNMWPLARALPADLSFYCFQDKGLDGSEPFESIEETARCYVDEIRHVQPHGPYYLGGTCYGGLLAFETARRLEELGEHVAALFLIDTSNPTFVRSLSERERRFRNVQFFIRRMAWHARRMLTQRPGEWLGYISGLRKALRKHMRDSAEVAASIEAEMIEAVPGTPLGENLKRVIRANFLALSKFVPKPYGGGALIFRASIRNLDPYDDYCLGWESVMQGGIECYEIEGDHMSILEEPTVRLIAEKLNAELVQSSVGTGEASALHASARFRSRDRVTQRTKIIRRSACSLKRRRFLSDLIVK